MSLNALIPTPFHLNKYFVPFGTGRIVAYMFFIVMKYSRTESEWFDPPRRRPVDCMPAAAPRLHLIYRCLLSNNKSVLLIYSSVPFVLSSKLLFKVKLLSAVLN